MWLIRFFSVEARSGVARWLAWFILSLGFVVSGVVTLRYAEGAALVSVYAGIGVVGAKLATECVRRLHDCGQSGRLGLLVGASAMALGMFGCVYWRANGANAVFWSMQAVAGVALAGLLLRPGMGSKNRYGPPPPTLASSGDLGGKGGLLVSFAFLVAGTAFGFAVLSWQAGMAREAEWRMKNSGEGMPPSANVADEMDTSRSKSTLDKENATLSDRIDALLNEGNTT